MTPLIFLAAAALLTAFALLAVQTQALPAGTVDPFAAPPRPRDPASDTVANDALTRTAPPAHRAASEWNVRTLTDLSEVERLLDRLEASGVTVREVHTIGEEGFAVRWK